MIVEIARNLKTFIVFIFIFEQFSSATGNVWRRTSHEIVNIECTISLRNEYLINYVIEPYAMKEITFYNAVKMFTSREENLIFQFQYLILIIVTYFIRLIINETQYYSSLKIWFLTSLFQQKNLEPIQDTIHNRYIEFIKLFH